MNRTKPVPRKSSVSVSNANSKTKMTTKKQLPDVVYLMQNENQILRIKNQQLGYKVDALNLQLRQRTHRVSDAQKQCQKLRQSINGAIYTKDIQLESQRKIFLDKIQLGQRNIIIYKDKISDARRQVIIQEERKPRLIDDRRNLQQQLRIIQMQNQGSKKILINLEQQHEQLRQRNSQMSTKKYSHEPEQKVISEQIQQRIRLIKNMNLNQKTFKKDKTTKLIIDIISKIQKKIITQSFLMVQRYGLKKAILKKKVMLISFIRKNYLDHIKSKVMSIFRQPLKPLKEQQRCEQILIDMRKRRQKARIWRIWRNQSAKAQYSLIRKYQSQNTIEKICQTITKGLQIYSFNKLKYNKNHHQPQISISKVYFSLTKAINRGLLEFLKTLKQCQKQYEIQNQIQKSAQQHSKMLIFSKIFYGWINLMKDKRKQSLSLKFKVFNFSYLSYSILNDQKEYLLLKKEMF